MTAIDSRSRENGATYGIIRDFVASRSFMGRPYLISPLADGFCAGAGSLLMLGFFFWLVPASGPGGVGRDLVVQTAAVFAFLAYFVNYPHFMASYELLYSNLQQRMAAFTPRDAMWWRYVNAAYLVPAGLILFFAWALWAGDMTALGMSVHSMFFFVGWHYVKQSYGVFVSLSGMKGVYYSPWEARLLRGHVYSLWLYCWYMSGSVIGFDQPSRTSSYWGVDYPPIPLYKAEWFTTTFMWVAIIFAILAYGAIFWNWRRTGKRPSVTGLLGYASMYPLFAFVRIHPLFTYAAPLFHSLQYMLFVAAYKRGEWQLEGGDNHLHSSGKKKSWMRWLTYFFLIIAMGALAFDVLPHYFATKSPHWGITIPAIFIFNVFINTHHYFIDSVIWRRGNKDVGKYLGAR